ncbi:Hypothetical protein NCS54_00655500 [Fusarium falciforme]|uniref:Hypothetical protein n=1 Tax=Fusarium falciforme TaxID=195108 RepID=UPI0023018BBB|nr:Hypothetical protein NCS54_00655500 [Fusarium falciforme]WAO89173.1 Hypothetical protein NCS54_00655500 [Fusarium falciforme]
MNQFHLFSKLPKELRSRIWEATCQDNGTLHTFGDRWLMHYLVPGMPPAPIQMPTPVALFVCYESRKVAHRWIKENKATKQFRDPEDNEALGMTLIREFDRDRDMLYVPRDSWYDFVEHMERDYEAGGNRPLCGDIGYLAVPAFTAYYSIPNLACIMAWARNLRAIYVVWDDLPRDPDSIPDEERDDVAGVDVHPRVEIVSSPSPGETVRMKHVDTDTEREFVEEAELEEWMDEMNDVWATTEVDEDMVDDEGCVKMPRINVRVAEIPRQRPW